MLTLETVAEALLAARAELLRRFKDLEKRLVAVGRDDERVRRLTTVPGVGNLVALTFVAAIDDPTRFRSSRQVGAYYGLTPSRYQSGETDVSGRISKIGDHGVRMMLYEAANVMLTRPVKGSALKDWALAVAKRAGARKAPRRSADRRCFAVGSRDLLARDGRARPQARRRPAPDARRRHHLRAAARDHGRVEEEPRLRAGAPSTRPARGPVVGTRDRPGRFCGSSVTHDCASLDWPDGSDWM